MFIVFIAPDKEMAFLAKEVLNEYREDIKIVVGLLNEAVHIAHKYEANGVDVIITRGGTALALKKNGIKTPIVEIPITGEDMAHALVKARKISSQTNPCIGVIVFPNMMHELKAFIPIFNLNIRCYSLNSEEEAPKLIDKAINSGVKVLLGGVIINKIASKRGLPVVLLNSEKASFLQAFREAKRIAYARILEKQQTKEIESILNYAYEGILAVDKDGKITVFNPVAQQLTGLYAIEVVGQLAEKLIPGINFNKVLLSGQKNIGQLLDLGKTKVLMNQIPIQINEEIIGAVATIQDVTHIQQMETKIRREIYKKGYIAKFRFQDIYGESLIIKETINTARKFARTNSIILITGETGVGKELFAQSIHRESNRKDGPFLAVNCAAFPENLLESELFGYVEGAFTGASRKGKPGLFELAHKGTIFLDEVSEIPLHLQGRFLRVIQEREVRRLGDDKVIPIDVRILCATSKDLKQLVNTGCFSAELYWRLSVLKLSIPPLRERIEDLPIIIKYFLNRFLSGSNESIFFTPSAMQILFSYTWPGNIRELENFCERITVMCYKGKVDVPLIHKLLDKGNEKLIPKKVFPLKGSVITLQNISWALEKTKHNKTRAAKLLGIHRTTLWRKLKQIKNKGK